ncbi:multiple RNA-binding domain-containing protein 1 isoform X1 [Rhodamnia argentea]|uniref:Multiple RNA-binding domain-containing protein 1 isoform X1 n=1 Tax=Rhodamnia argentea TaxID=178133 RepID=A0A8B8MS79_9MYRT|nr:multiple RNA-binding domain-containing protein 1 isoform X1 [Rhodamnia argentea]
MCRSRICVKNLPKHVAEDRLRELFSQKGEIKDVKLMRTIDGKSRQFAFIGFRTEQEAQEAIRYFNKSYIDTSRIICEIARKVGDPDIPRPWSRHSLKNKDKIAEGGKKVSGGDSNVVIPDGEKKNLKKTSESDDPELQEFLQVMQPRTKSKLWANDTLVVSTDYQHESVNGKPTRAKKNIKEKLIEAKAKDKRVIESSNGDAFEESDSDASAVSHDDVISDMDYFKSRIKKELSESESENSEGEGDISQKEAKVDLSNKRSRAKNEATVHGHEENDMPDEAERQSPAEVSDGEALDPTNPSSSATDDKEGVMETGRLFVRNLPYTASEEELEELFSKFGKIAEVHVVVDKITRRSKGFAYIQYALPESALRALEELDYAIFQGRLLHVLPALQKTASKKQDDLTSNQAPKTFKQRREEDRKASEASGDTKAWNTMFMRADTVVENIARKYGISKSDFLDYEADDLAVRIALGETQVIAETKKALTDAGVNVTSLEELASQRAEGLKRSNHVLLVKNLPYGCSEAELAKMFEKFGGLDQIILPPTKTMALVVFLEPSEARAAFRGLAYRQYKDAPLYLEWAPGNVLNPTTKSSGSNGTVVGEQDAKRVLLEQHVDGLLDVDVDPDRIESRSLFVKNLSFKTSDETLKSHFSKQMKEGRILSVRIKKHVKSGKYVSMGFGFLEFDSMETATNICRDLQGTILDGHALILQLCQVKKDEQVINKADKDTSSTKLLVRNVAFEATEKDLRKLFSPFGKIKSLRLPMKFGNHRGFAFVEYITKQEAQNALQALANTHLYGRHLVLERAKEGESLEELRARTAAQFNDENGYNAGKLSKKRKHMAILDEDKMKFERIADAG